jgi:2-methylfumaryl-CoA isomerase
LTSSVTGSPHVGVSSTHQEVPGPLAGLQILDLSTYVAGPSCGMTLAQLGADVIRIDPVGGATDVRRLPLDSNGDSIYWAGLNKAKRTIEIDTSRPEGRDLVYALLAASGSEGGILLTNAVGQQWLDYDELVTHRNDLIEVHVAGRADGKPAVDYTINCEVGLPLITGPTDFDRPVNHVLPAWDLLTGLHAAIGILSAERVRSRTGKGQLVTVSLADVAVATMGHLGFLGDVALNGRSRLRDGNYLYGSFGCDFRSRDGRQVMIVALTERQWQNLLKLTGTGEVIAALEQTIGVDLTAEEVRYQYREVLVGLFRPWFEGRDFDEIASALDSNRVLWGPYRSVEDLVNEPDSLLNVSPIIDEVNYHGIGTYPVPRSVLRFSGWADLPSASPPKMGEDTQSVLADVLGVGAADLAELRARGVVGGGPA